MCHKYSDQEKSYKSPYESIQLLQWSMIVGSIAAFISLMFALIAIFGRKSRYLKGLIYTLIFFTIAATVLFGLVIAYVNEDKQARKLVGSWVTHAQPNLKTSTIFAIGCAVTATSGMSLILCCVLAFVYEPEIKPAEESVENGEKTKEQTKEKKTKEGKTKESETKNITNERTGTAYPKRQGSKYPGKDVKERNSSKDDRDRNDQMNGHVNKAYFKDPAVITKDQEDSGHAKVRPPKHKEEPRQNGPPAVHIMQPRQNYPNKGIPPKDYGTPKNKEPPSQKHNKHGRGGQPRHPQQSNPNNIPKDTHKINVTNKKAPPPPTVPQSAQHNRQIKPNKTQPPVTESRNEIPLYDGDYDRYFNEPY